MSGPTRPRQLRRVADVGDPSRPRLNVPPRVGGDGEPEVFCADEQRDLPVDLERWQALATEVLRSEGVRGLCELSLLFVTELEMAELNELHMVGRADRCVGVSHRCRRRRDGAAWPAAKSQPRPVASGIPAICRCCWVMSCCARPWLRQAPEHAGTVDDEIALLVVPAFCVLGYDHDETAAADAIRVRELELLREHHWGGPAPEGFRQEQLNDRGQFTNIDLMMVVVILVLLIVLIFASVAEMSLFM